MQEPDDITLLRQYADEKSEAAFATLAARHLDLVYSAALRQTGGVAHRAEEITQAVFILLARKAGALRPGTILPGWLLRTVRFTAAAELRTARRRQRHEQEAHMEAIIQQEPAASTPAWEEIAPLLDEALADLGDKDRNALVLRFFKQMPLKEVGNALGTDEDVAQKRIARAVEKLRRFFARRGVIISTAAIIPALSGHAVHAAPAGLASTIIAGAASKGAAAASAATLTHATMQLMIWTKIKTAVVVAAALLFAAGTTTVVLRAASAKPDSLRPRVLELLGNGQVQAYDAARQMATLGPGVLPTLGTLIQLPDAEFESWYPKNWPAMPDQLKRVLSRPMVRRGIRSKAMEVVSILGAAASRPLTSDLIKGMDEADTIAEEYDLRALYWSLPDSSEAMAFFEKWLADPTRGHLFGDTRTDDLWPQIPQTVPALIACLGNQDCASDAAEALATLGSNAAPAIPALIEVCDKGWSDPPVTPRNPMSHAPEMDPMVNNRVNGLRALAKIGIVSPEVLAAFNRSVADPNELVRLAALTGLGDLHRAPDEPLTDVLNGFTVRSTYRFLDIVRGVGHLGTNGQGAVPWLRMLTSLDSDMKLATNGPVGNDFPLSPEAIPPEAWLAICQVDPSKIHEHLAELISMKAVGFLSTCRPYAAEIVAGMEPLLHSTNNAEATYAAYGILGLKLDQAEALEVLRDSAAHGELRDRLYAARWLWQRTGETDALLPLCREGLRSTDSQAGQTAATLLGDFGDKAQPAISDLKAALWNPDAFIRQNSAKALRKLAPEEMPEIR